MAQRIGLDVHGLVAVGLFRLGRSRQHSTNQQQEQKMKWVFHKGTKLARNELRLIVLRRTAT